MQDKIYELLLNQNEIAWQDIIYNLIKTEQMDPWDIDVCLLARRYLETVKKMQEMNFFISGKVLLASAFLVRLKSTRFIDEDMKEFDLLLYPPQDEFEDFLEYKERKKYESRPLAVKTPLARKRPVTINDLILALETALKVDTRKKMRLRRWLDHNGLALPEKKINISEWITSIFAKIKEIFKRKETITFAKLLHEPSKHEKILALYSLLHLETNNKIEIEQREQFGEILIMLKKQNL
ncbi:segregation/condensation protein A [archaeon]|nr:segregation/condensation protein A [archaeon]